jgi:hypothetical protein
MFHYAKVMGDKQKVTPKSSRRSENRLMICA